MQEDGVCGQTVRQIGMLDAVRAGSVSEDRRAQVGRWLRQRRDELGITRERLAKMLGLDLSTVTNAETGRRVPRFKSPWEDALRLTRGDLARAYLDGTPFRPVQPEDGYARPQVQAYTRTIMTPSGAEVSVTIAVTEKPAWFDELSDDELLLMLRDEVRSAPE